MCSSDLNIDATKVGGDFTAGVKSLGDDSTVDMGDGNNKFSALGSSGNNIHINSGKGNDIITGSGQRDYIKAGDGRNIVNGDRGDNHMTTGSGNDRLFAKDGSDTYVTGAGYDTVEDNIGTNVQVTQAYTLVTKQDGAANVKISSTGTTTADVDQNIAVGKGSELQLRYEGNVLKTEQATLDGRDALDSTSATLTGSENADL